MIVTDVNVLLPGILKILIEHTIKRKATYVNYQACHRQHNIEFCSITLRTGRRSGQSYAAKSLSKYYDVVYISKYINGYKSSKNFTAAHQWSEEFIKLIHTKAPNKIIIFDGISRKYLEEYVKMEKDVFYSLLNSNFLCTVFLGDE